MSSDEKEDSVKQRVTDALSVCGGVMVMRNNVGVNRRGGRFIRYGLEVGSADLICIVAPYGKILAIETKRPKGGKESAEQTAWLERVRQCGGIAGFVRSPEEALSLLALARKASL